MGARREEMAQVELVDDDGLSAGAAAGDGPAGDGPAGDHPGPARAWVDGVVRGASRWVRRRWPVLTAAVVVLVVVLGGVRVVQARDERAYLSRIAGMPGILAPLDDSVHELWRADTGLRWAAQWLPRDGAVIGMGIGMDGLQRIAVMDAATGAVDWAWSDTAIGEPATASMLVSSGSCALVGAAPALLLCTSALSMVDPGSGAATPTGPVLAGGTRSVRVFNPDTGDLVAQHTTAGLVGLAAAGDVVVVAEVEGDGLVRVSRHDPTTWRELWVYDAPAPGTAAVSGDGAAGDAAGGDGAAGGGALPRDPQLVVGEDGSIGVLPADGPTTVLTTDGALVRRLPTGGQGMSQLTAAGGRLYELTYADGSASGPAPLTVTDLRSGAVVGAAGFSMIVPGDGSLGAVVVAGVGDPVAGTGVALMTTDGALRWSADLDGGTVSGMSLVVRGAFVALTQGSRVTTTTTTTRSTQAGTTTETTTHHLTAAPAGSGQYLTALDARTGAIRFQEPVAQSETPMGVTLVTDGRSLLTVGAGVVGGRTGNVLTAHDARDGRLRWTAPLADDVEMLQVIGHRLFGSTPEGMLVALG